METYILPAIAALVILALGLLLFGRTRHKAEAVTTDALLKTAEDALAAAQRLADERARAIAADQAALAADTANIAQTRARLAGNAPAAIQP